MVSAEVNRGFERHWGVERDPFSRDGLVYVSTSVHSAAESALAQAIDAMDRLVWLRGETGLGKTLVLERVLAGTKSAHRRLARVSSPIDGVALYADLAAALGRRIRSTASRTEAWRTLREAVRVCRFQDSAVVVAIDESADAPRADQQLEHDLDRLTHLDPDPRSRVTIVRVSNECPAVGGVDAHVIRLRPLSRVEAAEYLDAKLRRLGRDQPAFTARAATRLHALSRGVPRALDRHASVSLRTAASRKMEIVSDELVDELAELEDDQSLFAMSP